MTFGLKESVIQLIQSELIKFPEIEQAIIYGSRAKGNFRPGSDIDLCLRGQKLTENQMFRLSLNLDDLMLPYTFDLSIYEKITNQEFKEHIDRVGCVFYQKKEN